MFCFALLLIVIWNKALTSHNQLNIQNIAQKLPVLLYFTCISPNTTLRAHFKSSRVLVIIRQVREVWCVHVHHYYCREKLDNIHPGGLALGHRSTGTIRALVAEECFNFLTNNWGQRYWSPQARSSQCLTPLLIEFRIHSAIWRLQLAFASFSQDL